MNAADLQSLRPSTAPLSSRPRLASPLLPQSKRGRVLVGSEQRVGGTEVEELESGEARQTVGEWRGIGRCGAACWTGGGQEAAAETELRERGLRERVTAAPPGDEDEK